MKSNPLAFLFGLSLGQLVHVLLGDKAVAIIVGVGCMILIILALRMKEEKDDQEVD